MDRIRTIGDNFEIATNWAERKDPATCAYRNGGNGERQAINGGTSPRCNFFFERDAIYSYGHHYCVGLLLERDGKTLALLNIQKWETTVPDSPTTRRHREEARRAAQRVGHLCVEVEGLAPRYADPLSAAELDLESRIKSAWESYDKRKSPRTKCWDARALQHLLTNYQNLMEFQGKQSPYPTLPKFEMDWQRDAAGAVLDRITPVTANVFGKRRTVSRAVKCVVTVRGGDQNWEQWFRERYHRGSVEQDGS